MYHIWFSLKLKLNGIMAMSFNESDKDCDSFSLHIAEKLTDYLFRDPNPCNPREYIV